MTLETFAELGIYPAVNEEVITTELGSTDGFCIAEKHLANRCPNIRGIARQYVPGHGGDVWFVEHHDGTGVAAYMVTEIAPVGTA